MKLLKILFLLASAQYALSSPVTLLEEPEIKTIGARQEFATHTIEARQIGRYVKKVWNMFRRTLNNGGSRLGAVVIGALQSGVDDQSTGPDLEYLAVVNFWSSVADLGVSPPDPPNSPGYDALAGAGFFNDITRRQTSDANLLSKHSVSDMSATSSHAEFHIPLIANKSLAYSANAINKGHTFMHVATHYANETAVSELHYRLAHRDDLGIENDGSYHHMRATHLSPLPRRNVENRYDGIVMDFLWQFTNTDVERTLAGDDQRLPMDAGTVVGAYMYWKSHLASCATLALTTYGPSQGQEIQEGLQGIMAYGWNNAPFHFNGRSAGWIAGCAYPA